MRKVALVNPRAPLASTVAPPFNLMSLSSYIKDIANVKIVDGVSGQDVEKGLLDFQPDWVGITVQTPTVYEAYRIADFVKRNLASKVVLGGVHASLYVNESIKHADHIVINDGEIVFKQLIKGEIKQPIIQGIPLTDLDEVPPFLWEEIDIDFYSQNNSSPLLDDLRSIILLTSRGCRFKCIFCHNSVRTTSVRFNSAKRVCLEVDRLMENYDIGSIVFADDEFLINKKRLLDMCKHFRDVRLIWGCQARATTITEEIADLLSRSGCKWVGIGFETGNQRTLNILKANSATVEENIKAIHILKKYGITVLGSFIFGTPSETKEEMMDTINFIIEQSVDVSSINSLTPYPASSLWNMLEDKFKDVDYSSLLPSSNPSVILCDTMDERDYKRVIQYATCVAKFKRGIRISRICNRSWLKMIARDPFYLYFVFRYFSTAMRIIRKAW